MVPIVSFLLAVFAAQRVLILTTTSLQGLIYLII